LGLSLKEGAKSMPVHPIKLTRGVPPPESFPIQQLSDCATAVLSRFGPDLLQYGAGGGFRPLQETLAAQAGVSTGQVIVGQGSLLMQDFLARLLLHPGDLAFVENPTYDRTILTLRRPGSTVEGIPMDPDGMAVDVVERKLRQGVRPVLLYTIPDFQNPMGTVLSGEKRRRLVELAETYNFWIVEDLPYRRLRYRGADEPAFFDLAPQRVIQMSSYSKLIGPGLRVGTLILPESLAPKLLNFVEMAYICPTYLVQAMVYEFIQRGWLEENIARLKALYPPRLQALLDALDEHLTGYGAWPCPEGGFFVGLTLNGSIDADELLRRSQAAALTLLDGRDFFTDGNGSNFVRLPFTALPPEDLAEGVARLASVVKEMVR
jgi:DNA-binding transcriptional MocR family regulator